MQRIQQKLEYKRNKKLLHSLLEQKNHRGQRGRAKLAEQDFKAATYNKLRNINVIQRKMEHIKKKCG